MRFLPWLAAFILLVGCVRPALHFRPAPHPGGAPAAVTASARAGESNLSAESTVAGAATYHTGAGTPEGPFQEETRPPAVRATRKRQAAVPARTVAPGKTTRVEPAHRQSRKETPRQDIPVKRRVSRLSLLSLLTGLAFWVPTVLINVLVSSSLTSPVIAGLLALGLLVGAAAVILGIRGANRLEARGEKGSLLSFSGILLGVLAIIVGFVGGVALLLSLLFG